MSKKTMSLKEFCENGLLYEVNRVILHPLGLEMVAIKRGTNGDSTVEFSHIADFREGEIFFTNVALEHGRKKLETYMKRRGAADVKYRYLKLGYIVQGSDIDINKD